MIHPFCPICRGDISMEGSKWVCSTCRFTIYPEENVDIEPEEAKKKIDAGAPILDVRRQDEWDIVHLDNAKLIPIDRLSTRLGELDREKEVVVYCHHGVRGAAAARFLRQKGFKAVNIAGGIDRWSDEIDASLEKY